MCGSTSRRSRVGYHVEAQKQQVEQLREQNRQLRLSEAQLTDPGRIDQIAQQLGLDAPQPARWCGRTAAIANAAGAGAGACARACGTVQ